MNKFIIFALLFVFVLNQTEEEEEAELEFDFDPSYKGKNAEKCLSEDASEKNCNDISLDDDYNCCYISGFDDENGKLNYCAPLNEDEEKKLKDIFNKDELNISIQCSSNYISNALLILLSLLF